MPLRARCARCPEIRFGFCVEVMNMNRLPVDDSSTGNIARSSAQWSFRYRGGIDP